MVRTLAVLLEERGGWKSAGQAVVFTNGCFDLLHPGHVALFEAARSQALQCDPFSRSQTTPAPHASHATSGVSSPHPGQL